MSILRLCQILGITRDVECDCPFKSTTLTVTKFVEVISE